MKAYAHEDISVGSWMMGLKATYIDDSRLCCSNSGQGNMHMLLIFSPIVYFSCHFNACSLSQSLGIVVEGGVEADKANIHDL